MGDRIRGHNLEVAQLQYRAVEQECQRGCQVSPGPRQQNRGHNNDQGIQKIERTIHPAGDVNQKADQQQVGNDLQHRLRPQFFPNPQQHQVKRRNRVRQHDGIHEHTHGKRHRRELRDRQFDAQQYGKNQDPNLDQPHQPNPVLEGRLHVLALKLLSSRFRFSGGEIRRTQVLPGLSPPFAPTESYPASLPISANSGMYSEMTMPPIMTPSKPMITGSSMASMSLVAESTSSS